MQKENMWKVRIDFSVILFRLLPDRTETGKQTSKSHILVLCSRKRITTLNAINAEILANC